MKLSAFIALLSIAASSCGRGELKPMTFNFEKQIGWLHGPCVASADSNLKPGTPILLITTGEPPRITHANIQEPTTSATICPALTEDRAASSKPDTTFYALKGGDIQPTDMAFGIFASPATPTIENGLAKVDLDQDGISEIFTSCNSSEGINFYVWSGKPYSGEPRWTKYYYLGYDMSPNCP